MAQNTTAIPLRIMPLGASVTFGVGSSTGNSYRKDLRDLLTQQGGHQVNMVGTHKHGAFADNEVEATSGFVIAQIAASAQVATPKFLPNLVLVDAGTNNCNNGGIVSDAGANVSSMIKEIFAASAGVTVLLATILENKVASQDACRVDINRQYRDVVAGFERDGEKIALVDMRSEEGPTTNDLFDTRHPNDAGYKKMAAVWNQGIQLAAEKGFLSMPASNGVPLDGGSGATAIVLVNNRSVAFSPSPEEHIPDSLALTLNATGAMRLLLVVLT
ncbi:SGNH hydrolase-type esterase domain-containing protein [Apodospora peruviana]|uniref:SGNH hydrolase-type esterase domain-containing protein n=1 Tax=Apodospora peruviana TaxID=516989 RepID=A0AAE0I6Y2_9PEZI|nr:SGNH hydrolase-type esterase domain-containing protein [Apodospora peruviana]